MAIRVIHPIVRPDQNGWRFGRARGRESAREWPAAEERVRGGEAPPADDCCPICFGSFIVPCRGPCGHWYCADCILQYWNHGAALQPCKCPMCSQKITRLIPDASLGHCQGGELLENVQKYNRLFVGGTRGLIMKVSELPLLMNRIIHEMMDPDAADNPLFKARLFAIFLGALYTVSPLDFLPTAGSRLDVIDMFDYFAIGLVSILYVVGLYRRRQRLQHVRQLVAVQPDTI
ncbi:uncharacterized protein LOC127801482 [Diospyros lotus]|uniref:uncharacterized protein LOC127801482 n=1 Tax=Diospyros lotus TaxID=55363 RepID=UPI002253BB46|nr:uncharacterized protein LOC127801482 [Diospyros lotus]